jgi:hypothetical protein
MEIFLYNIEDGQFSCQFEAPLLGNIGDTIQLYRSITHENGELTIENGIEFKILDVTRYEFIDENGIWGWIDCCGFIND